MKYVTVIVALGMYSKRSVWGLRRGRDLWIVKGCIRLWVFVKGTIGSSEEVLT